MPFDHNHHYHPRLLRLVPPGPGRALDVGCGEGRFARRLAAAGLTVDGIDTSAAMVARAAAAGSPGPGTVSYRQADVTAEALEPGAYGFISCLASLHHMPFDTVLEFRRALVPGGVLAVLGCARSSTPRDFARLLAAVPVNAAARLVVAAGDRLNGGADPVRAAPVRTEFPGLADVRRDAERLLPGCEIRPLLFWRYLLSFRKPWEHGESVDHPPTG
ncbi:class I SAM-dependent methyltransferase [Amycolatopsis jiangsuensis]|uniref:SAM-dependent methyltransferase n=1 Tax=Amycolatopsis jiangsuensis TaxID=1181879 RepID=A0A840J8E5_9PSEU|nr:class I SAM-dependent methyltransferase [Amycolatopsis jiangsuensis]MBB4689754.1 SAM-dependent methyltransferase [Amycolatopsis jiangsuensis]